MTQNGRAQRRAERVEAALSVPKRAPRKKRAPTSLPAEMRPEASPVTVRTADGHTTTVSPLRPSRLARPDTQWQGRRRSQHGWVKITTVKLAACHWCPTPIQPGRHAMAATQPDQPRLTLYAHPTCWDANTTM